MEKISSFLIRYFKTRSKQFYVLLFILVIAAILRFYNFPYRYGLGIETVRDAVIGIQGARELQFPLTGSFSSLGAFTFGPWYAYQLNIATLLFQTEYSPWIYLTIISILYVLIIYKIGEMLHGGNFALILAVLATFSPAQIISATHLTSHNNTNLFAALAILLFLFLIKKNVSYWWGFLLGLVIGIGINLHFQMAGLLIFPLILLIYKPKKYSYFLAAAAGVFVSFLPLLFFEVNNHWFTTRNMWDYLVNGRKAIYVPNRWLFYVRDFWPAFWADSLGIPVWAAYGIILLFCGAFFWTIYKKKYEKLSILLFIAFLINFILLRYYWGPRFFGYLNFLRPFVFIFTGYTIYVLAKTPLRVFGSLALLSFIILLGMPKTMLQLEKDPYSLDAYRIIAEIEGKYPDKKFALYYCSITNPSHYESVAFSSVFVLELNNKFDSNGMKLGLDGECKHPVSKNAKNGKHPLIGDSGMADFSKVSKADLKKAGWSAMSFRTIYDDHARWWFQLQP